MEKGKEIEAINGEFLLPEAIIQEIQSFLSEKEAARTSILSKSWYSAWLTRPSLNFDQRDFDFDQGDFENTWELAKNTMQKYEELKLKIQSFRLYAFVSPLADEIIVKAMKMGATDLTLDLWTVLPPGFVLPHEVLESKTLIRLSVGKCRIDLGVDGKVSCSKLKTLALHSVYFEGDDVFRDIILSCLLIEELSVSNCYSVKVQNSNVVIGETRKLKFRPFIQFGQRIVGSGDEGRNNLYEFRKMKRLVLHSVKIDALSFSDFSSNFLA